MSSALFTSSPRALRGSTDAVFRGSIATICLLALALRIVCSNGPVWNDEIWSLENLLPLRHFWQVLWGISHDNNHFLNSLWLFFAAPLNDNPTWLRLPSIVSGAAVVPAMAYLGARHSKSAALFAAALTGGSYFQITYSDQARGYASATLALVVAFAALERALDQPRGRARWVLAAAAGLGFFSHLAMAPAMAALGAAGFAETLRRRRNLLESLAATTRLFWPAALAMIPTLGFVAAGYRLQGGFTIGHLVPYAASHAIGAMANLELVTFGLAPTSTVQVAFALFVMPPLILVAIAFQALAERRIVYCAFFLLLPAAVLVARLPNTHMARYFFAASPFLLLLAAESLGGLWNGGGWRRTAAVAALVASLTGDTVAIAQTLAGTQSPWTDALTAIVESGDRTLASSYDFNIGKNVRYFNRMRDARLDLVPAEQICARKPAWYIVQMSGDVAADPALVLGADPCQLSYDLAGVYNRVPDQLPWALYRLKGEAPAAESTRRP